MKNLIMLSIAALILSACAQDKKEPGMDTNKWYADELKVDGDNSNQKEVLSCRQTSVSRNHHTYITVTVDSANEGTPAVKGMNYEKATLTIITADIDSNSVATTLKHSMDGSFSRSLDTENNEFPLTTNVFTPKAEYSKESLIILQIDGESVISNKSGLIELKKGGSIECRTQPMDQ